MPMRETPKHVNAALRAYDPELELRWADDEGCWYFYYQGRKAFAYLHTDGKLAMHPVADEAVELVRRADMKVRGGYARLKAMERFRREQAYQDEKERQAAMAEAGEHAGDRAEVFRRGPKLFVDIQSNPMAAGAAAGGQKHVAPEKQKN